MKQFVTKWMKFLKEEGTVEKENQEMQPVSQKEDQRQYFRMELPIRLISTVNIAQINGKKVNLKHTKVLIENIGPGGLQFLSHLNFSTKHDFLLKFDVMILGEIVELIGKIQWQKEVNGLKQYGVQFQIEEPNRDELIKHLNHLMIQKRNGSIVTRSEFYHEEPIHFFEKNE